MALLLWEGKKAQPYEIVPITEENKFLSVKQMARL